MGFSIGARSPNFTIQNFASLCSWVITSEKFKINLVSSEHEQVIKKDVIVSYFTNKGAMQ